MVVCHVVFSSPSDQLEWRHKHIPQVHKCMTLRIKSICGWINAIPRTFKSLAVCENEKMWKMQVKWPRNGIYLLLESQRHGTTWGLHVAAQVAGGCDLWEAEALVCNHKRIHGDIAILLTAKATIASWATARNTIFKRTQRCTRKTSRWHLSIA